MLILVTIVIGCLGAAYCWKYVVYPYDTQTQVLAPGVELIQTYQTRGAFPFATERFVVEQTLQFKGKTLWSSSMHGPGAPSRNFRASPNGRSVAFEDLSGEQLVSIVDINTGQIVKVPVPEPLAARDDQYYVYPFELLGWSQDSRALTFRVTGRLFLHDERRYLAYRELWTVDLDTLKATLIRRDEKPWEPHLSWE
jgi:hypothetical protein